MSPLWQNKNHKSIEEAIVLRPFVNRFIWHSFDRFQFLTQRRSALSQHRNPPYWMCSCWLIERRNICVINHWKVKKKIVSNGETQNANGELAHFEFVDILFFPFIVMACRRSRVMKTLPRISLFFSFSFFFLQFHPMCGVCLYLSWHFVMGNHRSATFMRPYRDPRTAKS